MFTKLKNELNYLKANTLFYKGIYNGDIVAFDENIYEPMKNTFINGLPVYINIKYLDEISPKGKCIDRSFYMFLCFNDAILVRGQCKNLKSMPSSDEIINGWVEIGDYVYDLSLLLRFKKELYYKLYLPSNISKYTKEDYCKGINKLYYQDIKDTTVNDYLPGGSKRNELLISIPFIKEKAKLSQDEEFIEDIENWINIVQYDEEEIKEEINNKINAKIRKSNNLR